MATSDTKHATNSLGSSVPVGATDGQLAVTTQSIVARVQRVAFTTPLTATATQSGAYTKTEVEAFLSTNLRVGGQLKINRTRSTYTAIIHLAFVDSSAAVAGSVATVISELLVISVNCSTWYVRQAIEFSSSAVALQGPPAPTWLQITATPTTAQS